MVQSLPEHRFEGAFNPKVIPFRQTVDTACECCEQWEAVVKLSGTKLCDVCAKAEGVEVL